MSFDVNKILESVKEYDWRRLKWLASSGASNDMDHFLEDMPKNVGQVMLMATVGMWGFASMTVLYSMVQMKSITELRAELLETNALNPSVPKVRNRSVKSAEVAEFVEKIKTTYTGLDISSKKSNIVITAGSTERFGEFREAVGHVQNGGKDWRVNVENLCLGRECAKTPLSTTLKISKIELK